MNLSSFWTMKLVTLDFKSNARLVLSASQSWGNIVQIAVKNETSSESNTSNSCPIFVRLASKFLPVLLAHFSIRVAPWIASLLAGAISFRFCESVLVTDLPCGDSREGITEPPFSRVLFKCFNSKLSNSSFERHFFPHFSKLSPCFREDLLMSHLLDVSLLFSGTSSWPSSQVFDLESTPIGMLRSVKCTKQPQLKGFSTNLNQQCYYPILLIS